ncbi:sensor histidine kinase [Nocardioides sp. YIM 152315]|uniref:sensor histidine kinase n=1 Tax=Nocardioides sp. YIM 152315 TaxID=3031760 RepID=UPI0023DB085E|nr:sensor histidine kinase [Nocardioides sp. YIM 152315]MDF1603569.1 sensor histidine kinase [Nocardioides sp. YIM 152315]
MTYDGAVRSTVAAGAAALLVVAALTAGEAGGGADAIGDAATRCMLVSGVAILCAAVFFYIQWHLTQDRLMAWLVTATAAFALQELNWFMLILGDTTNPAAQSTWAALFQIVVTAGLWTLVVCGDRLPVRYDPLCVGMLIGLVLVLLRIARLELALPVPSAVVYAAVVACLGVVGLWNAARLLRAPILTADLRHRIAVATVLLAIGQVTAMSAGSTEWVLFAGAVANTIAAALFLLTAAGRARATIVDEVSALRVLRRRLATVEHDRHTDQARLHEIRSTLAGITTATELLHRAEISRPRRDQLQHMTAAELRRLDRLLGNRSTAAPGPTELDATLRPVVVRHESDGLPIAWEPGGQVVIARPDDVAEIVNVLLSNARRHAAGGIVRLEARTVGDDVEVSVSDDGPGVDPQLRPRLFTWGARGVRSPGEGIGLASARLLAEGLGGHLRFDPAPGRDGARFVLSLAAAAHPACLDVRS